jgi:hypothetical protein
MQANVPEEGAAHRKDLNPSSTIESNGKVKILSEMSGYSWYCTRTLQTSSVARIVCSENKTF